VIPMHPKRTRNPRRRFVGICDVTTGECDDECSWEMRQGTDFPELWEVTVDRRSGVAWTHAIDNDHPRDYVR